MPENQATTDQSVTDEDSTVEEGSVDDSAAPAAEISTESGAPNGPDGTTPESATETGMPEPSVDIVDDGVSALVVAAFDTLDQAREAYEELHAVDDGHSLRVDGVVILTHDEDGNLKVVKATDHSARTGMAWGALGGVLVAVFFPPSILAGAIFGGAAGAVVGEVRKRHHKQEIADQLAGVIGDEQSGLIALVTDPRAESIQKALNKAERIVTHAVDDATSEELLTAAKNVDSGE